MDEYIDRKSSSIANGSAEIMNDIAESDSEVVKSIRKMLQTKLSSSSECNIYKVPKSLRSVNPKAYTPQVISIGPFHHGNKNLIAMEHHKLRYLQSFFDRVSLDPEVVVQKAKGWEERARNCYAEPIKMKSDEFVKIILVDGCFLVEYFIRRRFHKFQDAIDHLLYRRLNFGIFTDLIKLENQLPFFVLEGLFQLHPSFDPIRNISFSELIAWNFPDSYKKQENFLNFVSSRGEYHFVNNLWLNFIPHTSEQSQDSATTKYLIPPTATQLYEAGVIFKKAENKHLGDVITGITFKNGVLEIPHIEIFDEFETYLRNLIAFEQCHLVDFYVTHFAMFMDGLINTDRDVSLLVKGGIISNHLGNDKDVSKLFINLCKQVDIGGKHYYNDLCEEIQEYCGARWHRWMASLRRDYFNTAGSFISFNAAVVLLLLTLIQTIFSGLSINK